eukprot:TRINITY_DN2206_c0_g1_i1.p1 TRINITY_DN2206_c0_g1~~TRINITY_DN2206_c0_g1_i1.p1  ORF type:complete len:347 (-),score=67.54 TRINITY_DN2206_c0_g1_i1:46-1086(-)
MTPFWNWAVTLLPTWLAPNVISAMGAACVVVSFLVCALTCQGTHASPGQWWVHVVSALCLFLYQLFDNLDGKQARRTCTSSPLGELFDHGLDAIVMGMSIVPLVCAAPCPQWILLLVVLSTMSSFYTCHWEAYHTSVTNFSELCPVVEAQFLTIAVELTSAVVGPQMWNTQVYGPVTAGYLLWSIGAVCPLLGVLQSVRTVLRQTGWSRFATSLAALTPFAVFALLTVLWFASIPELRATSPYLVFATISLAFAYIQQRLLVQHLSKEAMHSFYPILGVYSTLVVYSMVAVPTGLATSFLSVRAATVATLAWCIAQECFFSWSVIWQMTGFLGIRAFAIVPPKKLQ